MKYSAIRIPRRRQDQNRGQNGARRRTEEMAIGRRFDAALDARNLDREFPPAGPARGCRRQSGEAEAEFDRQREAEIKLPAHAAIRLTPFGLPPPEPPYPQLRHEAIHFRAELVAPGEDFDQTGFELPPAPRVAPAVPGQGELFPDDCSQPEATDRSTTIRTPRGEISVVVRPMANLSSGRTAAAGPFRPKTAGNLPCRTAPAENSCLDREPGGALAAHHVSFVSKPRLALLLLPVANAIVAAQTNPTPASIPSADEVRVPAGEVKSDASKIVELNPFVVQESTNRGYEAENTLSGTRLSTPSKYVGAAVADVTSALIQDLALYNTQDLLNFTPNASPYLGGGLATDTAGNSALFGQNFYIRGLFVNSTSRDFILGRVLDDAYNADRISVGRGPNSILFGIASAGGLINATGTRAEMKDSFSFGTRFDNWGSRRGAIKLNRQIIKHKVALFLAGLEENKLTNRKPSDQKSHRITGSVTIKPFAGTTVRATAEHGNRAQVVYRPWPASDAISGWIAAGSQEIPLAARAGGARFATLPASQLPVGFAAQEAAIVSQLNAAGFVLAANGVSFTQPMIVINGAGDKPMPLLNGFGYVQTPYSKGVGIANVQLPTLVNSPLPYTANVLGYGNQLQQHFQTHTLNVGQAIGRNLFIDVTFNRQNTNNLNDYMANNQDQLYLDKNPTLATMTGSIVANPNYNRYYTFDTLPGAYWSHYDDQTFRVSAAYQLDFKEHVQGRWGKILGHHNFAAMREQVRSQLKQDLAYVKNTSSPALLNITPQATASFGTTVTANPNSPAMIHYIDPGSPSSWGTPDYFVKFPHEFIFAGSPLPTADPSGFTPGMVVNLSTRSLTIINSRNFVMQNYFWDDRIVPTFGWRRDASYARTLPTATVTYNGLAGYVPDAGKVDVYKGDALHRLTYVETAGQTRTQGIVIHPLRSIGLTYNQSQNFTPQSGFVVNLLGQPIAPTAGKGKDYGIKFSFLGGKILGSLTRYTTSQVGVAANTLRAGFGAGGMATPAVAIASTMFTQTGNPIFTTYPWPYGNLAWSNTSDVDSKGYEFSLTANVTPNWRLMANMSRQTAVASNYGGTETLWHATQLAYITANYPQYLNTLAGTGIRGFNETIAQHFQDVQTIISAAQSLSGRSDARQAKYAGNFVTAYDFTAGPLKPFGVGATFQWRSKMAIGYAFQPGSTVLYNPNVPYYSQTQQPVGLLANYKFTLGRNVRVRVQLNADGINIGQGLLPLTATDSGNVTPVVVRYLVRGGTTYALSTNFDF